MFHTGCLCQFGKIFPSSEYNLGEKDCWDLGSVQTKQLAEGKLLSLRHFSSFYKACDPISLMDLGTILAQSRRFSYDWVGVR